MVLERHPVSRLRHTCSRNVGLIDFRILVVDVKGLYPRDATVVFSVFNCGLKTNGGTTPAEIIQSNPRFNMVCNWKGDLCEKRWSPSAVIRRRNGKTKRIVERLVQ